MVQQSVESPGRVRNALFLRCVWLPYASQHSSCRSRIISHRWRVLGDKTFTRVLSSSHFRTLRRHDQQNGMSNSMSFLFVFTNLRYLWRKKNRARPDMKLLNCSKAAMWF